MGTGSHLGCVLSPLLFIPLTHDCTARFDIVKLADDTAIVGLIKDNNESAYMEEVRQLTTWCRHHNHSLNVDKTKEVLIDFRREQHATLLIDGTAVEKYLGVHIVNDLTSATCTSKCEREVTSI